MILCIGLVWMIGSSACGLSLVIMDCLPVLETALQLDGWSYMVFWHRVSALWKRISQTKWNHKEFITYTL